MRVIVFGATGMVGQGVLGECLRDREIEHVLTVGRTATDQQSVKLTGLVHKDFLDFRAIEDQLAGYDTCFFCLGVSSVGLSEQDYERVTFEYTVRAATTLARVNPGMTFEYISGMGTDRSEKGRSMWARVKGKTENALMRLPFKAVYALRPGFIQPIGGIKSKTGLYQAIYTVLGPLYPVGKALLPNYLTTTEQLGRAMIALAKQGAATPILEVREINALGERK